MSKKNMFSIGRNVDGESITLSVTRDVYDYIKYLENKCRDMKRDIASLEQELKDIKPVLEIKELKPAVSLYCADCNFVVKSKYDGRILGCAKNIVCNDFYPKED